MLQRQCEDCNERHHVSTFLGDVLDVLIADGCAHENIWWETMHYRKLERTKIVVETEALAGLEKRLNKNI